MRDTHERCSRVRRMLQTHMAKYEERDVFMSRENQRELRQRLALDVVDVPHVFGDGVYMGVSGWGGGGGGGGGGGVGGRRHRNSC